MNRVVLSFAAVTLPFGSTAPAEAASQFVSGNFLYEQCTSDQTNYTAQNYCLAYIVGVSDTGGLWQDLTKRTTYCLATEVTAGQVKDVAVAYLRDHPETRHDSASGSVMLALMHAFPCAPAKRS